MATYSKAELKKLTEELHYIDSILDAGMGTKENLKRHEQLILILYFNKN